MIVFGATLVHALWYDPDTGPAVLSYVATSTPSTLVATSSEPARLRIPSIGVNAAVQYVGVNAQGNMRAPDNFTDVAWYQPGTVPGTLGSAVIDGHVDNGLGLDGVFKHLDSVKVGDSIYVDTNGGKKLHFVVTDIELYPYQSVPTQKLFGERDEARLNLITCGGSWVNGGDTYDHRLVIYSVLQSS